jgi:D-alanyl-D-alanine carboxypeptidase
MRGLSVFVLITFLFFNGTAGKAIAGNTGLQADSPQVTGASVLLMDLKSGQILFERKPHDRLAIASITKIMTAIVAIEKGNLDSVVSIGPEVLDRKKIYGTLVYLTPGEEFTLSQLLSALLMNSANDAAVAIAKSIGGNEENFIQMMNQKARDLGLKDTHFINPHGLSEIGHYSSAYDMAIIARYGLQKPALAEIVKTKVTEFPRSKQGVLPDSLLNRNKLLWQYDGADGVKTGYTNLAGNTIVASATRNDRQLLVVILKGTSGTAVNKDTGALLDYGFNHFYNKLLASKDQVINSVSLENGQILNLSPATNIYGTVTHDLNNQDFQLKTVPMNIKLPVKVGDEVGRVDVYYKGDIIHTVPLIARNAVPLSKSKFVFYLLLGGVLLFVLIIIQRIRRYTRKYKRRGMEYDH